MENFPLRPAVYAHWQSDSLMQLTVWVLVVVFGRDRMYGLAGSVTSTRMSSFSSATSVGSSGLYCTRSAPTSTKRLITPSIFFSP